MNSSTLPPEVPTTTKPQEQNSLRIYEATPETVVQLVLELLAEMNECVDAE